MQRQRRLLPSDLIASLVSSLSVGNVKCLSDLHRALIRDTDADLDYRSFHDRLNRASFPDLMRDVFLQAAEKLVFQALRFSPNSPFSRFHSVLIQDGSSFALHDGLAEAYPGRFKKNAPAAVELHATFDLLANTCETVSVAPGVHSERAYLPAADDLTGFLLLADRGYPSYAYLAELDGAGASFVMRAKENLASAVVGLYRDGVLEEVARPVALKTLLAKHRGEALDLVVQVKVDGIARHFRVVALPNKTGKGHTILLTNLPHAVFSAEMVGLAYKLRWQVELIFREWKSHANLQRFVTRQKPIAEGLIWTSLLVSLLTRFTAMAAQTVGKVAVSTLKAAKMMAAHPPRLMLALLRGAEDLEAAFEAALDDLMHNGRRAHPKWDRLKGREQSALRPAFQC